MNAATIVISFLFAVGARADLLPGKYSTPQSSHYSEVSISDIGGMTEFSALAWFRSDDGSVNVPAKISGIVSPTSDPGRYHLKSGVITLNYGIGSRDWECRYPYYMDIYAKGASLLLQGFEPGGIPPSSVGCPALKRLEPYQRTEIYGPFRRQSTENYR